LLWGKHQCITCLITRVTKEATYTLGDVNNDEQITVTDIVMLRGLIAGEDTPTDAQKHSGDINSDGDLTVTDIVALRGLIAG